MTLFVLFAAATLASAQSPPPAAPRTEDLAATIGLYVFPAEGQKPEKQSQDEAECYNWAVQNTGTDPFQLGKQAEEQKAATAQASSSQERGGGRALRAR